MQLASASALILKASHMLLPDMKMIMHMMILFTTRGKSAYDIEVGSHTKASSVASLCLSLGTRNIMC